MEDPGVLCGCGADPPMFPYCGADRTELRQAATSRKVFILTVWVDDVFVSMGCSLMCHLLRRE